MTGQKWQHFKGTVAEIVTTTKDLPAMPNIAPIIHDPAITIKHTETGEIVRLDWDGSWAIGIWLYATEQQCYLPAHSVYKHPSEDGTIEYWARPLDNFLDVLSNGKAVNPGQGNRASTMYYRFTLLPEGTQ